MTVKDYILSNLDKTVRSSNGKDPDLIDLPEKYNIPSIENDFQEMYYWDTYFTNKGLLLSDRKEQAVNNLKNFVFLINKFGYIPNGNRNGLLNRSQPPVFALAVSDVFDYIDDNEKESFIAAVEKEYEFWSKKRSFKSGLNHFDSDSDDNEQKAFVKLYKNRTGKNDKVPSGKDVLAECESGWDFSPRFPHGCTSYAPIDLNCLLWFYEEFLSDKVVGGGLLKRHADRRRSLIQSLFSGKDGIFYDYDVNNDSVSGIASCAGFFPYYFDIPLNKTGFINLLSKLEKRCGVIAAENPSNETFQWASPNCWAPMVYICAKSAKIIGEEKTAYRISEKYIDTIDRLFEKEGKLFEKYNAFDGSVGAGESYGTPEMLGWTASVYLVFDKFIKDNVFI